MKELACPVAHQGLTADWWQSQVPVQACLMPKAVSKKYEAVLSKLFLINHLKFYEKDMFLFSLIF